MKTALINFEKHLQRRYPDRSTAKHYLSDLHIFHQFVGTTAPTDITVQTIDAFIENQQAAGMKASTINRRLSTLASFFDFLSQETNTDDWRNPVRWKRHRVKQGRHLPRDVQDETAEKLLAVVNDPRDRAIFILMLAGGLRVGEVVALDLTALEAPRQHNLARLRVSGKGGKERLAWLTQESWQELQAWLAVRPETTTTAVFLNQHGRRLSVSGIQFRLKQYTQQAGVQLSCHQLRHTYARRLAERDVPLDSLAKLLGHSSLQTTQLYIDGADPVVRRDFEQAMAGMAASGNSMSPSVDTPAASHPEPTPSTQEERPDEAAILKELAYLTANLPTWLQEIIRAHMRRRMPRWVAHHVRQHSYSHLHMLRRVCAWLLENRTWDSLAQLQRRDLLAYVDYRLDAGIKASTINAELAVFHGLWRELLEREQVFNGAILLVKAPPEPDRLPRYLKPEQFQGLLATLAAQTAQNRPRDHFDRAWFYLLAHAGLRSSEAMNIRLEDCALSQQRLRIRSGKGDRDRVLPMTATLRNILAAYLPVRETSASDHLLIFRHQPAKTSLIASRLRQLGKKAGVTPLSPHRLRHTLATLLVNQGMPITSLQKFLGHQDINTTLIYARVFDATVQRQFAAAMAQVEAIAVANWPQPAAAVTALPIALPESMPVVNVQETSV